MNSPCSSFRQCIELRLRSTSCTECLFNRGSRGSRIDLIALALRLNVAIGLTMGGMALRRLET